MRPSVVLVVMAHHGLQQVMTHASLPHGWGWFGRCVLQSPAMHRVHHGQDRGRADHNFGCFMILDHIFGTYAEPDAEVAIGVQHTTHNRRLFPVDLAGDAFEIGRRVFALCCVICRECASAGKCGGTASPP
jgi:sterol desaturase/sphingolipid hydroxylase (fatty acid hydroxylase superfamily)